MKYSMFKLSTVFAGALLVAAPEICADEGHDNPKPKAHGHAHDNGQNKPHDHSQNKGHDHKHEGHDHSSDKAHDHGSKASTGAIMSSHDGMTALYAHLQEISAALKADKVDGVHDHAEAIGTSVKDLDKDTSLTDAKRKRVRGYVKNVVKLADKIHHAADEKKLAQAKKDFVKLQAQVDLLDKQFAHSHKPGIAAKPKAEGHQGHHHHQGK